MDSLSIEEIKRLKGSEYDKTTIDLLKHSFIQSLENLKTVSRGNGYGDCLNILKSTKEILDLMIKIENKINNESKVDEDIDDNFNFNNLTLVRDLENTIRDIVKDEIKINSQNNSKSFIKTLKEKIISK